MAPNFCPCMRLQQGVKLLAIIDAVLTVLFVIVNIVALIELQRLTREQWDKIKLSKTVATVIVIIDLIVSMVQLCIDILLYHASNKRNWRKCLIWLIVTGVTLIKYIYNIANNASSGVLNTAQFGFIIIFLIYKLYEMVVVFTFIQQLREERSDIEVIGNGNPNPLAEPVSATPASSHFQSSEPTGMQYSNSMAQYQNQYGNVYTNAYE